MLPVSHFCSLKPDETLSTSTGVREDLGVVGVCWKFGARANGGGRCA